MKTIILIVALFSALTLSASVSIEDTQGRSLEAEILQIGKDSVTFKRVGDPQKFTVEFDKLSEDTLRTLQEIQEMKEADAREAAEDTDLTGDLQLVLENGKKLDYVRVLSVDGDTITYEINTHFERGRKNMDLPKHIDAEVGDFITLRTSRTAETIKIVGHDGIFMTYEMYFPTSSVKKLKLDKLSVESQALLSVFANQQIEQAKVLAKLMTKTIPIPVVNESDKAFDTWLTQWYVKNFFTRPGFPDAITERFLQDPILRIEFFDAFTTKEEAEKSTQVDPNKWTFRTENIRSDNALEAAKIITEIYKKFPKESVDHINLTLALALMHDNPRGYYGRETRIVAQVNTDEKIVWLTPYLEVFEWKTRPENLERLHFKPQELGIEQNAWANTTSQSAKSLSWALNQGLDPQKIAQHWGDLYGKHTDLRKRTPIETIKGGVCRTMSYLAKEKLLALNIPSVYSIGQLNINSDIEAHAYVITYNQIGEGATVDEVGNTDAKASGVITMPTNNIEVPDGCFIIHMSERYNSAMARKMRVKTQFAGTLKGEDRLKVLRDIVKEDPQYGEAQAQLYIAGDLTEVPNISEPIDKAQMHQLLFFHFLEKGNAEGAKKAFEIMAETDPDERVRLAWGIQTLNLVKTKQRIEYAQYLPPFVPNFGATFGYFVFSYIDLNTVPKRDIEKSFNVARLNGTREFSKLANEKLLFEREQR